jgi:hypothetical protein
MPPEHRIMNIQQVRVSIGEFGNEPVERNRCGVAEAMEKDEAGRVDPTGGDHLCGPWTRGARLRFRAEWRSPEPFLPR